MASVVHDTWCTTDFLGVLGREFDGQRGARQTFWVSWDASLMASVVRDRLLGVWGCGFDGQRGARQTFWPPLPELFLRRPKKA